MKLKKDGNPKKSGGKREGAGRSLKEETVTTGFRVHKESLDVIRENEYPINSDVNKLVKRVAEKLKRC